MGAAVFYFADCGLKTVAYVIPWVGFLCVNVTLRDKLYVLFEKNKVRARTRPAGCLLLQNYSFHNYPDIDRIVSKGTVSINKNNTKN